MEPPGMALDARWMSEIARQVRGVADRRRGPCPGKVSEYERSSTGHAAQPFRPNISFAAPRYSSAVSDQLVLDLENVERNAVISRNGRYRYEMTRRWGDGPLLEWVLLNPSKADTQVDDPSTRKCCQFASDWGFHGIRVTNLFALRSPHPDRLLVADDPVGPRNRRFLAIERGPLTVVGWGVHPVVALRAHAISALARRSALMCLGYNHDGSPKHPLFLPRDAGLWPWPKPDPAERRD